MNTIECFKAKIENLLKSVSVPQGQMHSVCIDQDHETRIVVVTCKDENHNIHPLFTFKAAKLSKRRLNIIFGEVDFHLKQVMLCR